MLLSGAHFILMLVGWWKVCGWMIYLNRAMQVRIYCYCIILSLFELECQDIANSVMKGLGEGESIPHISALQFEMRSVCVHSATARSPIQKTSHGSQTYSWSYLVCKGLQVSACSPAYVGSMIVLCLTSASHALNSFWRILLRIYNVFNLSAFTGCRWCHGWRKRILRSISRVGLLIFGVMRSRPTKTTAL